MAGDWIPFQKRTIGKSEVGKLMVLTGRSRHEIIGLMIHFWSWAEDETVDGTIQMPLSVLPSFIGADDAFWSAVVSVGWIDRLSDDAIRVPRADHWLTKGAKARLLKNRRQAEWRVDARVDGQASTESSTTEEKRTRPKSCSSSSSSSNRSRSGERLNGRHGLLPPFDVVTVETLSDAAKLRPWFLASAAAISLSDKEPGWELCCAAAQYAIAEGRKPVHHFQKLLKDRKGRDSITPRYFILGKAFAKGAA